MTVTIGSGYRYKNKKGLTKRYIRRLKMNVRHTQENITQKQEAKNNNPKN